MHLAMGEAWTSRMQLVTDSRERMSRLLCAANMREGLSLRRDRCMSVGPLIYPVMHLPTQIISDARCVLARLWRLLESFSYRLLGTSINMGQICVEGCKVSEFAMLGLSGVATDVNLLCRVSYGCRGMYRSANACVQIVMLAICSVQGAMA